MKCRYAGLKLTQILKITISFFDNDTQTVIIYELKLKTSQTKEMQPYRNKMDPFFLNNFNFKASKNNSPPKYILTPNMEVHTPIIPLLKWN